MPIDGPERRRRPRITGIAQERVALLREPEDSAKGCRARAEADLRKAREDVPANARLVLEASAKSWLARADVLERLESSSAKRRRKDDQRGGE